MFFGDFWQLDPVGGKSFMSNPFENNGDPYVEECLPIFWQDRADSVDKTSLTSRFHLQHWSPGKRVLELNTNIRSGEDAWYSQVLDECRMGCLSEANYNFLHGLPTKEREEGDVKYKLQ